MIVHCTQCPVGLVLVIDFRERVDEWDLLWGIQCITDV